MANNQVFDKGLKLAVVVTNPASPLSGGPVRYGNMTGVAMSDMRADGLTPVDFGFRVYSLSVKGVNDGGNSAVAVGDSIFYVDADTPKLSKKASGFFFGTALAVVNSGATTTINVLHLAQIGIAVAAGAIGTSALAANAVTAGKLTTTLGTGFIPLPMSIWRAVAANDVDVKANAGGLLAKDTAPIFERVNVATDKQQRVRWAAASVIEIMLGSIISPPDLDNTSPVIFKIYAAMAGATDTPVLAMSCFEGVGGANLGGNTGSVTGVTPAVYSANFTPTAVAGAPKPWSFGLVPAAHGTDALHLYSAWLEYTRK